MDRFRGRRPFAYGHFRQFDERILDRTAKHVERTGHSVAKALDASATENGGRDHGRLQQRVGESNDSINWMRVDWLSTAAACGQKHPAETAAISERRMPLLTVRDAFRNSDRIIVSSLDGVIIALAPDDVVLSHAQETGHPGHRNGAHEDRIGQKNRLATPKNGFFWGWYMNPKTSKLGNFAWSIGEASNRLLRHGGLGMQQGRKFAGLAQPDSLKDRPGVRRDNQGEIPGGNATAPKRAVHEAGQRVQVLQPADGFLRSRPPRLPMCEQHDPTEEPGAESPLARFGFGSRDWKRSNGNRAEPRSKINGPATAPWRRWAQSLPHRHPATGPYHSDTR